MRRLLLTLLTLCSFWCIETAHASLPKDPPFFSYAEWKEIYSTRRCPEDLVVLIDGSKICGTIEAVPALDYSFGSLDFDVSQIAVVTLASQGPLYRVQYISRDGQNFIAPISANGRFSIWINEPSPKNPDYQAKKEINPKLISFILLKERDVGNLEPNRRFSSIELKNGDHLPAIIKNDMIPLSTGWSEEKLSPENIIEVYFNGGLQGQILREGMPSDLGFMFVKDRFLTLQLAKQEQLIRLPWDQIASIQARNGGFRHENPRGRVSGLLFARPYVHDLEEAIQLGIQTTEPDGIGFTKGELLAEASGAICIAPNVCEGLLALGTEKLTPEPTPFPPELEEEWLLDITLALGEEEKEKLKIEDLIPIHEALIFECLPKKEMEPETFDVEPLIENPPPEPKIEEIEIRQEPPIPVFNSPPTPPARTFIDEITYESELDDFCFDEEFEDEDLEDLSDEAQALIDELLEEDNFDAYRPTPLALQQPEEPTSPPVEVSEEPTPSPLFVEPSFEEPAPLLESNEEVAYPPPLEIQVEPQEASLEPEEISPEFQEIHEESLIIEEESAPGDVIWDEAEINPDSNLTTQECSLLKELGF